MSVDAVTPRSRRAILAAALGGVAATVAGGLGRPQAVSGANNDPILLGRDDNAATATTEVTVTGALYAMQVNGPSTALQGSGGSNGLTGFATNQGGIGVGGYATNTTGTGRGVFGGSSAPGGAGIYGESSGNSTGVFGLSRAPGGGALPGLLEKVGVYGSATQDGTARGVVGASQAGTGVHGIATTGNGIRGEATTGTGVRAAAISGGTALAVSGRATFSRSGRASVAANKRSVDVVVPGGLAPTTLVVATLETYRSGTWVTVARKNYPVAGTVRIYLNKVPSTTSPTVIGWIAIN